MPSQATSDDRYYQKGQQTQDLLLTFHPQGVQRRDEEEIESEKGDQRGKDRGPKPKHCRTDKDDQQVEQGNVGLMDARIALHQRQRHKRHACGAEAIALGHIQRLNNVHGQSLSIACSVAVVGAHLYTIFMLDGETQRPSKYDTGYTHRINADGGIQMIRFLIET